MSKMAHNQYARWTPMYNNPNEVNTPHSTYKPVVTTQTLEIDDHPPYPKQSLWQRCFGGLKRTLRAFTLVACLVLAINIGWLLYAKAKYGIQDGYGTIQEGDCSSVKQLNAWFHLAINILSTLLLTGSNAFMAAYSGPTRNEIDKAHARRRWLHVGCMSFRNMRGIAKRKSLVVLLLGLSSIPFHLLYNSLVFTSLSSNNYYWAVVTEDFLTGSPFNLTGPMFSSNATGTLKSHFSFDASLPDDSSANWVSVDEMTDYNTMYTYFDNIQQSAPGWEHLDQEGCIQAYSNQFLSIRRNLVLVSSTKNDSSSIIQYGSAEHNSDLTSNWWICSEFGNDGGKMKCNPQDYTVNATLWNVFGNPIEYCMSERVKSTCSIKFSMDIMIVVVVFNSLKVIAMLWILYRLDAEHLLASVGDAAMSFIRNPDQTTWGMCLASKRSIDRFWRAPGTAVAYNHRIRGRWGHAVSKKRWALFMLLMLFAFSTVFFFGLWGFLAVRDHGVSLAFSSLLNLGFGIPNQMTMVLADDTGTTPIGMSILANIPQVILSLIYLFYMGIMNAMFNAADWAKFASTSQKLMVSSPTAGQRGTWLLGAPLGHGIGLLTMQTLLHWFVSQSIFFVQITFLDKLGHQTASTPWLSSVMNNCGYSPIAIIFSVLMSFILCIVAIIFMLRRLPAGAPPVVATCSAAISAACHVPPSLKTESIVYEALRWGVTAYPPSGPHHCSLASEDAWKNSRVFPPRSGYVYAGIDDNQGGAVVGMNDNLRHR